MESTPKNIQSITKRSSISLRQFEAPKVIDDETFIRMSLQDNPQKGFEMLYNRFYKPLCSHAVRFVYSKDVAEDIISDIFLSIWKNKTFENIHISYRAYLFTSVRNRCFLYLQQEHKKFTDIDDKENTWIEPSDSPEEMMFYDELRNQIEKSIGELPPQCQKVFLMNRYEGKKYKEIAEELNIAQKTIEAHISKALAHLRQIVYDNSGLINAIAMIGFTSFQ